MGGALSPPEAALPVTSEGRGRVLAGWPGQGGGLAGVSGWLRPGGGQRGVTSVYTQQMAILLRLGFRNASLPHQKSPILKRCALPPRLFSNATEMISLVLITASLVNTVEILLICH